MTGSGELAGEATERLLVVDVPGATRSRWIGSLLLGTLLSLAVFVGSNVVPRLVLGRPLAGTDYAAVGLLQIVLVPAAVWIGLRPLGIGLRDLGVKGPRFGRDLCVGLATALGFAVLQFAVLIPATGGAGRSDVAANAAQLGDSLPGVIAFIVLAWTGGLAEELLFRGHFLTTLRNGLGTSRTALFVAASITVVVFALLHGYQGWAGVVDSGLYGGVALTALFLWTDGRLTACAAAHAGWNSLAAIGIYVWY